MMRSYPIANISKTFYFCIYALLFLVCLIPIYNTQILPLVDYPNHLARMYIISHISQSGLLQQFYEVKWAVLPNLAMDVIVPNLAGFMELNVAGRTFVAIIFLLISGGTIALHYALHRRLSFWPFLVFLFLYNRNFLWGFVNYLFGVGLLLWIFAAWIFLRDRSKLLRIILFSALNTVLFFSHLFALGIYGLVIAGYEFGRYRKQREEGISTPLMEWIVIGVQFLIPAILFVFASPTAAESGSIEYGSFFRKIVAPFSVINNYNLTLDIITFIFLSSLLFVLFITRRIKFSKPMFLPLLLIAITYFCIPEKLFSSYSADTRIPFPLVLLLLASTNLQLENWYWKFGLMIILFSIFFLRIGVINANWLSADQEYVEYMEAFDKMQPASRLYTVVTHTSPHAFVNPPVWHVASLAVIAKDAFVPSMFAFSGQQPLAFTPYYEKLAKKTPESEFFPEQSGWNPLKNKLLDRYDYLLIVNKEGLKKTVPENTNLIYVGSDFYFYKLMH